MPYLENVAKWTLVEGLLSDGLLMRVYLAEHEEKLRAVSIGDNEHPRDVDDFPPGLAKGTDWKGCDRPAASSPLGHAVEQVDEYFAGRLLAFDVPLSLQGTTFQVRVWEQLLHIPFGVTRSYGDLAAAIGHPTALRAVAAANGRNRLGCRRLYPVIG